MSEWIQAGALGVLALHLFWGLPRLFQILAEAQAKSDELQSRERQLDRSSFEVRAKAIAAEIANLRSDRS